MQTINTHYDCMLSNVFKFDSSVCCATFTNIEVNNDMNYIIKQHWHIQEVLI